MRRSRDPLDRKLDVCALCVCLRVRVRMCARRIWRTNNVHTYTTERVHMAGVYGGPYRRRNIILRNAVSASHAHMRDRYKAQRRRMQRLMSLCTAPESEEAHARTHIHTF